MVKKIKNFIIITFMLTFSFGVGGVSYLLYKAYKDLPDITKLIEEYDPIIPTIIYDTNGEIIDRFFKENREIADIDDIPLYVQNAFLAIEDKKFRTHYGFDPLRVMKSVIMAPKYILARRNVPGGSTITQQLVKNAFLTNERKLMRKVKEAMIAVEIERRYTKAEILEKYLNEIYFGSGAYGIKTAAKVFFDKNLNEITLAEAALLAGVPNRPVKYSPVKHLDNAVERQKLILKQMNKFGFITEKEYKEALKYSFVLKDPDEKMIEKKYVFVVYGDRKFKRGVLAPDFIDLVNNKVFEMFDEKEVYESGLKIYTTLDVRTQRAAEEAFAQSQLFKKRPDLDGGLVTIDSQTGYVRAVIGGKAFQSQGFNRAFMAQRQPGSSFKPFLYYTALKLGYQMNLVMEDSKLKYGDWEPENYAGRFDKNITILESIERSVNISAIKLLRKVGLKNLIANAKKLGIKSDIPYNLTAALGTMSITPFELASAYTAFSNGGYQVEPIFITKITDRYGKVIYENRVKKEKIVEPEEIALLVHMMKDVVELGSGRSAQVRYKDENGETKFIEQAGKTGTTNAFRTAWFSGYTPEMVTTLYIGRDDNKSMGNSMSGGAIAAPLWGVYAQKLFDRGIYKPSRFEFLDNLIAEKVLVYEDIDSRNGLLTDKTAYRTRKALFKRGYTPIETSAKYKNGLDQFFPKELLENDINEDEDNSSDGNKELSENDESVEVHQDIEAIINDLEIFD